MHFLCKYCRGIVEAAELQAGQEVQCGHCDQVVVVPVGKFSPGVIIGDFCIEREIAKGGMGVVYLSRQISLDRPAALKILQPHLVNDPTLVKGLIQEARAAAKLNHPNIVQAYAVGEDDGIFYFAMEFVDGPTMKAVLKEEKVIQPRRAAEIIMQIADALDCAWKEQKLTHRDLKPDNIILSSNGRAKLADLGLSQVAGSKEEDSEEVLGTPQYISPEQLTGVPVDTRSDLYSLGATFFQFVTGRFPYVGKNADEIVRQHVEGTLTAPIAINKLIPKALNDIIVKLMDKNPDNRYQTPAELVKALQDFLDGKKAPAIGASAAAAPIINIVPPGGGAVKINFKKEPAAPAPITPVPAPVVPVAEPAAAPEIAAPPAEATPAGSAKVIASPVGKSATPLLKKPVAAPPEPAPPAQAQAQAASAAAVKSKPKSAPSSEAQKQKIKLIVAVVLLLGAGIIVFLQYGGMELFESSDAAAATPATAATETAPAPAAAAATPAPAVAPAAAAPAPAATQVAQPGYNEAIRELIRLGKTMAPQEFVNLCQQFFQRFPNAQTNEEQRLLAELRPLYAAAEAELRAPQPDAADQAEQEQARREAEELSRKNAELTAKADADVKALSAEMQQRVAENTRSFAATMDKSRQVLSQAFLSALLKNDAAIWQSAWDRESVSFRSPWPELTPDGKARAEADLAYFEVMAKDFPEVRKMLEFYRANAATVWSYAQLDTPDGLYVLKGPKNGKLLFRSLLKPEEMTVTFEELTPEALAAMTARVDKKTGIPGSLFFGLLSVGEATPGMAALAPLGFWKDHFADMVAALEQ